MHFPIALNVQIHPTDSARAVEWYQNITRELKTDLLAGASVSTNSDRGRGYKGNNVNDADWDTYWATPDGVTSGSITFTFKKPTAINRLMLQEYIPLGQRIKAFDVEALTEAGWQTIDMGEATTTVGYKRLLRFATIEAKAIRINFTDSKGPLCINNIEAFLAPALLSEPRIARNGEDMVRIYAGDINAQIYYTTDGIEPSNETNRYTEPFKLNRKAILNAIAYEPTLA